MRKYVLTGFMLLGLVGSEVHSLNLGNDWPNFMGPNFNGTLRGKALKNIGIRQSWKTNVGTGFSSIAVVDGRVYTIGNRNDYDTVFCLNAKDGKIIWTYSYPCKLNPLQYEGGPNTTPTFSSNKLYVLGKEGQLFCFNPKNGAVLWSDHLSKHQINPPKFGFSCSPIIYKDLLILNVGQGGAAFDKNNGRLVWKSQSGDDDKCYATPLKIGWKGLDSFTFFVGDALLNINPLDGSEHWRILWKTKYNVHPSAPAYFSDNLFVSAGNKKGCALYSLAIGNDSPELLWSNKNMHNNLLNSIYDDGFLYGIDGSASRRSRLKCIDANTGAVRWKNDAIGFGSLLLVDKKLVILTDQGILVIAEANKDKYQEIVRQKILDFKCWTPPAMTEKYVYARNAAGDMVCVTIVKKGN